jgi:hypothetical protein
VTERQQLASIDARVRRLIWMMGGQLAMAAAIFWRVVVLG